MPFKNADMKSANIKIELKYFKLYDIIDLQPELHDELSREARMTYSYNKLWKLLIDKRMLKKDLMAVTGITSTTMAKLGKDQPVNMNVLGRICSALHCNIGDIVDVAFEDDIRDV
jgi:DNA-binding Xre family transcriptional regulator